MRFYSVFSLFVLIASVHTVPSTLLAIPPWAWLDDIVVVSSKGEGPVYITVIVYVPLSGTCYMYVCIVPVSGTVSVSDTARASVGCIIHERGLYYA